MKNPITALARMFRRSENPVITQLYTHAIGRPLLIHPAIGAQVIGAYMAGAVDGGGEIVEPLSASQQAPRVAVLNISGGLVSRPMPGMCDDGPLSYEAIRDAFDASMADDSVTAIVMRMDSPGGMVSGCFDLTDHIHASRGTKPIVAVVDDMAYSAAYAIASACDEVWVSRTGGVGSIGVVAYHVDQSGLNEKIGLKVTPIYAGGHKVDFSPHAPLSDDAREREQGEVDSLYQTFVASVAAYRGMNDDDVRGTDAMTYTGAAAVSAGLADKIGTFRDALASVMASTDESPSAIAARESAKASAEDDARKMAQAAVTDAVMAANLSPAIAVALIGSATPETVDARIADARTIATLCAAAKLPDEATAYVAKGVDVETVRAQLQAVTAEDGPELSTSHPLSESSAATRLDVAGIYQRRNQRHTP